MDFKHKLPQKACRRSVMGVMWATLIVLFASTDPAVAQQRYRVTGVDRSDVLNMRAEPGSAARIVGTIPSDGVDIVPTEQVAEIGRSVWWAVRYRSLVGWVNARFLTLDHATAPTTAGDADLEDDLGPRLRCAGTEPFWQVDLSLADGVAEFSTSGGDSVQLRVGAPLRSSNHATVWSLRLYTDGGADGIAFLKRTGACSDGMSDTVYAHELLLHLSSPVAVTLSGCCE